jgi:glycosyltransferase involved in cell wall biosynthesis
MVWYSCRTAWQLAAVSENTKRDIIKYLGINDRKIHVIYEGVTTEEFNNLKKDDVLDIIRKKYGLTERYVYCPTSLHPHKNIDLLVNYFAKLKEEKGIPHKLVITGVDPFRKEGYLRNSIVACHMEKEILYLGHVSRGIVNFLFKCADMVVCLSSYEGFGLPVIEAMAAGCPVLSSNRASLSEVVGESGVLVDPFDERSVINAMFKLLTDDKERSIFINKGFNRAKYFSWYFVASNLIKIYG